MRRQHSTRSGTSCFRPFILSGMLTASLLFTPHSLIASETSPALEASFPAPSVSGQDKDSPNRLTRLFTDMRQYFGIRYRFGGTTPAGFDCSGFVRFMFGKVFDMQLPRSSREMSNIGTRVDRNELKPGDLVFFHNKGKRINHVGIFVGNGMFVHSSLSKGITRSHLDDFYYDRHFSTGVRVLDISDQQVQQEIDRMVNENAERSSAS